jgi:hypothetical protein
MRSEGEQAPLEIMGLTQLINRNVCTSYVTLAVTPLYNRSIMENRIADCLFGNDLLSDTFSAINVTGSAVANRDATKDWLADYFGLPTDYHSMIRFLPVVANFLTDFYLYAGLNHLRKGLYVTIHAPLVRTSWNLDYFEAIAKEGVHNYPPGYVCPDFTIINAELGTQDVGVPRTDLLASTKSFFSFCQSPKLCDSVIFQPLRQARFAPHSCAGNKHRTGLADIHMVIGYNFVLTDCSHLGIGLRAVAPTGNLPRGIYTFEPMVGNGGHWQLGAQFWGHYMVWRSENHKRSVTFTFLMNITHMFNAEQTRVFDLCGKPNSRYMLAERLDTPVNNLRATVDADDTNPANFLVPNAQFAGTLAPVANLTTRKVKVNAAVNLDVVTMVTYAKRNLTFDLGYNLWSRSCERITKLPCPTPLTTQQWALKGTAHTYGFTFASGVPPVPDNTAVALSATQSNATIHAGAALDNNHFAAAIFTTGTTIVNDNTTFAPTAEQAHTSLQPVIISEDQLDIRHAQTRGLANKLFFNVSYSWLQYPNESYVPFFGGGCELVYGNKNVPQRDTMTNFGCMRCALSQWGVWVRGGFLYR